MPGLTRESCYRRSDTPGDAERDRDTNMDGVAGRQERMLCACAVTIDGA